MGTLNYDRDAPTKRQEEGVPGLVFLEYNDLLIIPLFFNSCTQILGTFVQAQIWALISMIVHRLKL